MQLPNLKSINILPWSRKLLLWPISIIIRLWLATLQIEIDKTSHAALTNREQPTLFLFWHNVILSAGETYRRFRKGDTIYGLISASKDGAWLSAFFDLLGIGSVRGSSSFRGSQASKELLQLLQSGVDIAITPDGPRGPIYQIKEGLVRFLETANCPFVLAGSTFANCWQLKSWDSFKLPKPFSKIQLNCLYFKNLGEFLKQHLQKPESTITETINLLENVLNSLY